jgi:hypothetical protein
LSTWLLTQRGQRAPTATVVLFGAKWQARSTPVRPSSWNSVVKRPVAPEGWVIVPVSTSPG